MIILEKPYVSDFLITTIKKNKFKVLNNEIARKYFTNDELVSSENAVKLYNDGEKFYTNSENSLQWIDNNLNGSDLKKYIEISKDKALFRKKISKIYPNFYFKETQLSDLKNIDTNELKFPFIIKPAIGFLSFGVYPVHSEQEWTEVLTKINFDMEKIKNIFPKNVVDTTNFIIEEMIEGKEYALDAYYDNKGNAVILNIFEHPFFDSKDVSDRAYLTSKAIFNNYYEQFLDTLNKIGRCLDFKNYPCHVELRTSLKRTIPIEINPLRFCGWCLADIAQSAWGINVYEYYFKSLKPDWNEILSHKGDEIYYFTIADLPKNINYPIDIDYENYLKNIKKPLEFRQVDYSTNPIFAMVFAKTNSYNEIKNILQLDMKQYVKNIN